jgi:hypothetical protein
VSTIETRQVARRRPSPEQIAARHREIARHYARKHPPFDKGRLIEGCRRNEIEDLIQHRYGALPDTHDRGDLLRYWAWHNLRSQHAAEDLIALGRRLGVKLPAHEVERTIRYVNRNPRRFTARRLGTLLKLTEDERTILSITTIRADGVTDEDMAHTRRALAAERMRKRRCAKAMKPRGAYLENSLSQTKPWKAEKISRATWFRHRETSVFAAPYLVEGRTDLSHAQKEASERVPSDRLPLPSDFILTHGRFGLEASRSTDIGFILALPS